MDAIRLTRPAPGRIYSPCAPGTACCSPARSTPRATRRTGAWSELIGSGGELPFELEGAAIYYCGPAPAPEGFVIGSAGPTTSGRMDAWAPLLIGKGLAVMIGKGPRKPEVIRAMRGRAVYLAAAGGAGAALAACVTGCETVAWPELGPEAVRRLTVRDMPLTVAVDAAGGDLYELGPKEYLESLKKA